MTSVPLFDCNGQISQLTGANDDRFNAVRTFGESAEHNLRRRHRGFSDGDHQDPTEVREPVVQVGDAKQPFLATHAVGKHCSDVDSVERFSKDVTKHLTPRGAGVMRIARQR
jgi:hypothetical protein